MTTISEITTRNFEATTTKTRTAFDMALTPHNCSQDGKYARCADGSLWIWSDRKEVWIQIDMDESLAWK
jgi:hypothetical protein